MINIKTEDQTYETFFIKDNDGKEYEFYKNINRNYEFNKKLLFKICNRINNTKNVEYTLNFDPIEPFLDSSTKNRNYSNEWNFLIHATSISKLKNILIDGKIKAFGINENWGDGKIIEDDVKKVFTSYMFSDLIYVGNQWNFYSQLYGTAILIFDIKLLYEDNIVCPSTQFGECMSNNY